MIRPLLVALALLTACNLSVTGVAGSGVAASEPREVPAFEQLALSGSFAVEVEVGPARSVRIEADDNIVPLISTEVKDNTLHVSSRGNFHTSKPIVVHVTNPTLTGVDHSGSGSVHARGITGERFTVGMSGSGAVELAGTADALTVSLDGSGSLAAKDLVSARVTVSLSGSGGVTVHASEKLTASVSGSGSVQYTGGAKDVVRNIDGSGSVTPL